MVKKYIKGSKKQSSFDRGYLNAKKDYQKYKQVMDYLKDK